jgi:hypothetical protein
MGSRARQVVPVLAVLRFSPLVTVVRSRQESLWLSAPEGMSRTGARDDLYSSSSGIYERVRPRLGGYNMAPRRTISETWSQWVMATNFEVPCVYTWPLLSSLGCPRIAASSSTIFLSLIPHLASPSQEHSRHDGQENHTTEGLVQSARDNSDAFRCSSHSRSDGRKGRIRGF